MNQEIGFVLQGTQVKMAITYGLLVERTDSNSEPCEPVPVPLTGVTVNVRIVDLVAEVNIEQRYVNREQQPIEAVYKFPLDEGMTSLEQQ